MKQPLQPYKIFLMKSALLLGSTMTIMAGTTITPAQPKMEEVFQDILLVKMIITLPALFIAISASFAGIGLDKWGRKPVLIIGLVLYGVSGSIGYVLDSLYAILISRAFLGIAVAGIMTACTTLIGDYFKEQDLNKVMGQQAAFMGFGGVLFLFFGGLLASISWQTPFLIYLFPFFILPIVLYSINEPGFQKKNRKLIDSNQNKSSLPLNKLVLLCATAFFGMTLFFIIPVQIPFYLKSFHNGNHSLINLTFETKVGMALAISALFAAFTSMFYQKIKQYLSFLKIFFLIFLLLGTGFITIANSNYYYQVIIGLIICGLGMGLLLPNLNTWLVSIVPIVIRGRAVGELNTFLYLGQFSSPIIVQPLIDYVGFSNTFTLTGTFLLIIAVFFLILEFKGTVKNKNY